MDSVLVRARTQVASVSLNWILCVCACVCMCVCVRVHVHTCWFACVWRLFVLACGSQSEARVMDFDRSNGILVVSRPSARENQLLRGAGLVKVSTTVRQYHCNVLHNLFSSSCLGHTAMVIVVLLQ